MHMHTEISLRPYPRSDRQYLDSQEHIPALIPNCNAPTRIPLTVAPSWVVKNVQKLFSYFYSKIPKFCTYLNKTKLDLIIFQYPFQKP